jgi:murein DD-endopeptidase MepM/ murein hydrolase activator NlpD
LPSYGRNRLYGRATIVVAIVAVLVVGVTALTDDANAQAAEEPTAQPNAGEAQASETQAAETQAAEEETLNRGRVELTLSKIGPTNRLFFDSGESARFRFRLEGKGRHDVTVRAINTKSNKVVRNWKLPRVPVGKRQAVRWNGKLNKKGFAKDGKYTFKVFRTGRPGSDPIESRRARGKSRLNFYRHIFPVRARHTFGDGWGAGRGHRGQDVFAKCGKKIRAARGGRVKHSSYHSRAGHYVVIAGRNTGWDYVYMHLQKRGKAKEGQRVRTGQVIGHNGETGNASGCHLHFEMWSPSGWYSGGKPRPVTKRLKRWDRYS